MYRNKCICGGISVEYPWNTRGISVELVWNKVFWRQFLHRIRIYKVFSGKIPSKMCDVGDGDDKKH
jgi:hypothetical protein